MPKIFYEIFTEKNNISLIPSFDIYKAPELYINDNNLISEKSDMYGLGVILYTFACGQAPFQNETELKSNEISFDNI